MRLAKVGVILAVISIGLLALPASAGASGDPTISISSTSLNFGDVTVGTISQLPVTVTLSAGEEVDFTGGNATFNEAQTGCLAVPHFFGPGTCVLTVNFAPSVAGVATDTEVLVASGDNGTTPGIDLSLSGIGQATQTVAFHSLDSMAAYGGTYAPVLTGGASGNPIVLTSTTPAVCTVPSADEVSFVGVGECTLDANQAGGPYYLAAPQAVQSFFVEPASTTLVAAPVSLVGTVLGLHATFSATLVVSGTIQAVAGQTINFSAGVFACSGVTNADGVATCSVSVLSVVSLLLDPGYAAAYAGSTDYSASSATGSLTL